MLAAVSIVVVAALGVADVPNPRHRDAWVADTAEVLDAAAESRLDAAIGAFHARTGVEIAVVTADAVDGTPKEFATALFNHWGVGKAASDNGVLVLLVMSQRRLEIEVGIGMASPLPADWLGEMQAAQMIPHFKDGRFGDGLEAGIAAIVTRLSTTSEVAVPPPVGTAVEPPRPASVVAPPAPAPAPDDDGGGSWAYVLGGLGGVAGLGGAGALARRRWWRKMRTCEQCAQPMLLLDELADDEKLDAGQRKEEDLGSVDYRVLVCPGCQWSRTLPRKRWLSGYRRCSSCAYKTATRSSTTLTHATYDHGGTVQVTERCAHCGRVHQYTYSTPRRTRPSTSTRSSSFSSSSSRSSSSSSSRSSFGGGRSRGGGSGSSW